MTTPDRNEAESILGETKNDLICIQQDMEKSRDKLLALSWKLKKIEPQPPGHMGNALPADLRSMGNHLEGIMTRYDSVLEYLNNITELAIAHCKEHPGGI